MSVAGGSKKVIRTKYYIEFWRPWGGCDKQDKHMIRNSIWQGLSGTSKNCCRLSKKRQRWDPSHRNSKFIARLFKKHVTWFPALNKLKIKILQLQEHPSIHSMQPNKLKTRVFDVFSVLPLFKEFWGTVWPLIDLQIHYEKKGSYPGGLNVSISNLR